MKSAFENHSGKEVLGNRQYFVNDAGVLVPVSASDPMPMAFYDADGNPLTSLNGALDVHDADVHSTPINEFFHLHTGVTTTLAVAATAGDTQIDVVSSAGFIVGDDIHIENPLIETTFPRITAIVSNTVTLDRPLDLGAAIGATVEAIETDMAVSGTLASPVSYKITPDAGQEWHITSFIIAATFGTAADDSLFGNLTALTNGCTLRGYNGTAGAFRTFTNWKTNSDIKMDMYDVPYTDKAGAGLFGLNGNGAIKIRTGAVPKLHGDKGDYLELLVQDNISGLSSMRLKAQGHIEGL